MARWWTSGERLNRTRLAMLIFAGVLLMRGANEASPAQGGGAQTAWDGLYTEAQAERGKVAYEEQCAFCHLSDLSGQGFAPPLVDDAFTQRWQDGNLGDLFTIVKVTMPQDKPQSLNDAQYAEIVAHMLRANKYPAGAHELKADPEVLKGIAFKKP